MPALRETAGESGSGGVVHARSGEPDGVSARAPAVRHVVFEGSAVHHAGRQKQLRDHGRRSRFSGVAASEQRHAVQDLPGLGVRGDGVSEGAAGPEEPLTLSPAASGSSTKMMKKTAAPNWAYSDWAMRATTRRDLRGARCGAAWAHWGPGLRWGPPWLRNLPAAGLRSDPHWGPARCSHAVRRVDRWPRGVDACSAGRRRPDPL